MKIIIIIAIATIIMIIINLMIINVVIITFLLIIVINIFVVGFVISFILHTATAYFAEILFSFINCLFQHNMQPSIFNSAVKHVTV